MRRHAVSCVPTIPGADRAPPAGHPVPMLTQGLQALRPHRPVSGPLAHRPQGRLASACLQAGLALALSLVAGSAQAQDWDRSGDYRQEVRSCREGRTAQDLPTCLLEARNAEADRRRGRLTNRGDFMLNALARCAVFPRSDEHAACEARITGPVHITGSVAGGGLLREVAIAVPATPPGTAPEEAMGASPDTAPPPPATDTLPEDDPDVDTEERMLQAPDESA